MFSLSYITRYTIEQKIMHAKFGLGKSLGYIFIAPALIFLLIVTYINFNNGVTNRFSAGELALIEQTYPRDHTCSKEWISLDFENNCFIESTKGNKQKILLWGDSHANHFTGFFEEVAKKEAFDIDIISFPGCPPIAGVYRINRTYSESCYLHNQRVQKLLLKKNKFDYVALAANWANYPLGPHLADNNNKDMSTANSERAFYSNMKKQLKLFSDNGIKVIYLNSVPNFKNNANQCQLKNLIFDYPEEEYCKRKTTDLEQHRLIYDEFVKDEMTSLNDVFILDFVGLFCENEICAPSIDGELIYSDSNHISDHGSRVLYNKTFKEGNTLLRMLNDK
jgi:hypothetical protein